jgi:predicted RNase H-like HicB family nuclease
MKKEITIRSKTTHKRKSLDFYFNLKYPVTIVAAPEGGYFVEIEDLPGCFAEGNTVEEAYDMIEIARKMWIESMYEDGNDIPLPRKEDDYSGKFNVRLPKSLHRKLDQLAVREGVSLNQYLVSTLSHAAGMAEASKKKAIK